MALALSSAAIVYLYHLLQCQILSTYPMECVMCFTWLTHKEKLLSLTDKLGGLCNVTAKLGIYCEIGSEVHANFHWIFYTYSKQTFFLSLGCGCLMLLFCNIVFSTVLEKWNFDSGQD